MVVIRKCCPDKTKLKNLEFRRFLLDFIRILQWICVFYIFIHASSAKRILYNMRQFWRHQESNWTAYDRKTRWSSMAIMLERFVILRSASKRHLLLDMKSNTNYCSSVKIVKVTVEGCVDELRYIFLLQFSNWYLVIIHFIIYDWNIRIRRIRNPFSKSGFHMWSRFGFATCNSRLIVTVSKLTQGALPRPKRI